MKKCIITIGRQCGSGGHTIGKKVAERLEVPFYDKKLVEIVAERSGLSAETVKREGEYSSTSSLFTSVSSRGYSAYNASQKHKPGQGSTLVCLSIMHGGVISFHKVI